jgi:hypothetical protein
MRRPMRRPLLATTLALTTILMLAGSVMAGGWATVVMDDANHLPPAGQPTTLGFTLWQHANTKVSWPRATITFKRDGSTEAVVVEARAQGATGHYVADVTLPTAGTWSMTMISDLYIETKFDPITVSAPLAPAKPAIVPPAAPAGVPVTAPTVPEPATGSPSVVVFAVVVGLALLLSGVLVAGRRSGMFHRRRRPLAGS